MNKFLIIATLCSFLLLAIVLSVGFKSFGNMTSGNNSLNSSAIVRYANKAMATAKNIVAPVLNDLGVDVNSVDPRRKVKQELERAGSAVNEATKKITQ